MKRLTIVGLLTVVLIAAGGCHGARKVGPKEFSSQYELGNMQTMKQAEYLGMMNSNAYMRVSTMSIISRKKWNKEVIYTPIRELAPELQKKLISDGRVYVHEGQ